MSFQSVPCIYLYWDNFKQSVGLQGFYQFYYTLAERAARLCRGVETLYSSSTWNLSFVSVFLVSSE